MPRPTFMLADAHHTVAAFGKRHTYSSLDAARHGRAKSSSRAIVGAISFDPLTADQLWEPEDLRFLPGTPMSGTPTSVAPTSVAPTSASAQPPHVAQRVSQVPAARKFSEQVAAVIDRLRSGEAHKVVLGRAESFDLDAPLDVLSVYRRFAASDSHGNAYLVDLDGDVLIGSSPEVLVSRQGQTITAFPLAGTRPRRSQESDAAICAELEASQKDHAEHRFVTEAIADVLGPLCSTLDVPNSPQLVATPTTWHLGTPISGVLRDETVSVLDLVAVLHPTPAVGGTPTGAALSIIRDVEGVGARGFFGGALGYCTGTGDGVFRISIRGVTVDRTGRRATAWAGAGITAHSVPDNELHETAVKLARARQGLGLSA